MSWSLTSTWVALSATSVDTCVAAVLTPWMNSLGVRLSSFGVFRISSKRGVPGGQTMSGADVLIGDCVGVKVLLVWGRVVNLVTAGTSGAYCRT
ncbi:hypothetical protein DPMN_118483 [Dreissena polymorpha]|uniref:Secreted protein n=1 Tax=Dreissena polymorpha TaxID=45954 RepID=A0A9D4GK70_DREPO|nr:hypothetical protein DPMN_118483 [Dreissena polymorpha]